MSTQTQTIGRTLVLRENGTDSLRGLVSPRYIVREDGTLVGTYSNLPLAVRAARLHAPDGTVEAEEYFENCLTIIPIDFRGWPIPS